MIQFISKVIATSLSVPATASTTTNGPSLFIPEPYDSLVVIATLTGMSASTLDVYLQESWDGGTNWGDVAHYTQLASGAAAATTRFSLAMTGTSHTIGYGSAPTPTLAAATFCDGPWSRQLRIVSVTGTGANAGAVTQSFVFVAVQQAH